MTDDFRHRLPVKIKNRRYLVDLGGLRWGGVDSSREMVDQGAESGENSLSQTGHWKRTHDDWRGGAGQRFFDRDDSSRDRYWDSKGVQAWGNERQLKLLHAMRKITDTTPGFYLMAQVGNRVYLVPSGDTRGYFWDRDTFMSDTPGLSSATGAAANVLMCAATDGYGMDGRRYRRGDDTARPRQRDLA